MDIRGSHQHMARTVPPDDHLPDALIHEIEATQQSVDAFIDGARPRVAHLTTIGILCSAAAAVFTAAPAMGGVTFTEAVRSALSVPETSNVWRVLCLAAALVSIASSVSVNLLKADDLTRHLAAAEAARTHLRTLRIRLDGGEDVPKARGQLVDILTAVPFIDARIHRHRPWATVVLPVVTAGVITVVTAVGLR